MKKFILLLIILSCFIITYTQETIYYDYDLSGNRTYRSLEMPSQEKSTADKDSKEQKEYKDLVNGKNILIYPNPVSNELTIVIPNLDDDEFASLILYDQSGRLLYKTEKATLTTIINLANQSPGIYFLNICIGNKKVQWKIIKE